MDGSATFTIVMSRNATPEATIVAVRIPRPSHEP